MDETSGATGSGHKTPLSAAPSHPEPGMTGDIDGRSGEQGGGGRRMRVAGAMFRRLVMEWVEDMGEGSYGTTSVGSFKPSMYMYNKTV